MKYEKFLIQVNEAMLCTFAEMEKDMDECYFQEGNIIRQMVEIDRLLWCVKYDLFSVGRKYIVAMQIPKEYVENCKCNKWESIVNKYMAEFKVEI
jgi:hypothetical protein